MGGALRGWRRRRNCRQPRRWRARAGARARRRHGDQHADRRRDGPTGHDLDSDHSANGGIFTPTRLLLVTRDFAEERTNAGFSFTFFAPVASNAIGPQSILALATDADSNIVSAAVAVDVRPSAVVTGVSVEPPFLNLTRPGAQCRLAVNGRFY